MKKLTLLIILVGALAGMSACTTTRETRSVNTPLGSVSTTTTTIE